MYLGRDCAVSFCFFVRLLITPEVITVRTISVCKQHKPESAPYVPSHLENWRVISFKGEAS